MIKELISLLPDQQRKQLMCAFEQNIDQVVYLDDGKFLGVHVVDMDKFLVEEKRGAFSYGRVKR